ncbi:hypothetical protein SteCoe_19387 [Stentor coeruleus]|uniref:Uncharacterized protein n=1 Tax=Stentor coeruleus TaxID=5963 RepID=A0A1R2BUU1_9CILI|nr:hypothetical protein SteCoe_19387 [Stentor coeruleus]
MERAGQDHQTCTKDRFDRCYKKIKVPKNSNQMNREISDSTSQEFFDKKHFKEEARKNFTRNYVYNYLSKNLSEGRLNIQISESLRTLLEIIYLDIKNNKFTSNKRAEVIRGKLSNLPDAVDEIGNLFKQDLDSNIQRYLKLKYAKNNDRKDYYNNNLIEVILNQCKNCRHNNSSTNETICPDDDQGLMIIQLNELSISGKTEPNFDDFDDFGKFDSII